MKHPLVPILTNVSKTSCPFHLNFHSHSKYSDGSLTPLDLYLQANSHGVKHLAITDHHSYQAYIDIKYNLDSQYKNKSFITNLWSGIEISGIMRGYMVHVLALGFDIDSPYLKTYSNGDAVTGKNLEVEEILKAIKMAKGLSILAHPARYRIPFKDIIKYANELQFDGVEVWYDYERNPIWTPSEFICSKIDLQRKEYDMLATCGTDTHGISILKR